MHHSPEYRSDSKKDDCRQAAKHYEYHKELEEVMDLETSKYRVYSADLVVVQQLDLLGCRSQFFIEDSLQVNAQLFRFFKLITRCR
jgi:hypothetical protein